MIVVTSILVAGILSGLLARRFINTGKVPDKIMTLLVILLLFLMGYSIGSKKYLLEKLFKEGRNALLISVATVLGSILTSYPLYRYMSRKKDEA